jgi:transketolase
MPCVDVFESQSDEYKESVIPKSVTKRIVVEASSDVSWYRYAGVEGRFIGMTQFGQSAPYSKLFEHYGFTVDNVVKNTLEILGK